MENIAIVLIISAAITGSSSAAESCGNSLYCFGDKFCCKPNTACCDPITSTIPYYTIIGIVIGCIVFISLLVAGIYCFLRHKGRTGQVIQPQQQRRNVAVISAGQYQQPYGQPPYGQPSYGQPSYSQQPYSQPSGQQPPPFAPPPYGTSSEKTGSNHPGQDMAYPPPPSDY